MTAYTHSDWCMAAADILQQDNGGRISKPTRMARAQIAEELRSAAAILRTIENGTQTAPDREWVMEIDTILSRALGRADDIPIVDGGDEDALDDVQRGIVEARRVLFRGPVSPPATLRAPNQEGL